MQNNTHNNKRLAGAKFILCDDCGNQLACGVTNQKGEVVFDCLPFGKYIVKEIEAPCGFEKSNNCATVCIDGKNSNQTVEFANRRLTGSIKVISTGTDCCKSDSNCGSGGRASDGGRDSERDQRGNNERQQGNSNRNQNSCSCSSCQSGDPDW